ncbi:probable sodium/potassium/calcium exchanger CG1090 [Lepeophtheirus salmonis]|uniref:probable sodium/potassium/calcium exchanger CG1090 n=1 Tax=Lepeophtheirus salmonis TaxID=72036 RepID=UPI001AE2B926|nr:probable sodium/potassium/calcium exchanger CG1090 [Lepeophtheirus salmonis]XP_040563495.1 probable sodium/potassium/calcium exchanger CG1090 [Lepeophtheirus salmonis]XP_040563496.1 probable sodium/potassium/calcium exchanger CG1090 [Lepeophtheirus salmonis]
MYIHGRRKRNSFLHAMILGGTILFWIGMFQFFGPSSDTGSPSWKRRELLEEEKGSGNLTEMLEEEGEGLIEVTDSNGNTKTEICIQPAIEQFPPPAIGYSGRIHGGIIFHILIALYMFIGLSIVCDDFFVPSLDKISQVLNLPPDVAGATFMAAGSSAPELATAVIGVFVAKDDIGISGVIGSAVFNITLVIAVCALASEKVFYLNWYSVSRDCFCYLISILVLMCTIANESVSWLESFIFLVLYVLYCVGMGYNSKFHDWANTKIPVPSSWKTAAEQGRNESGLERGNGSIYKKDAHLNRDLGKETMEMGSDGTTTEVPLTPSDSGSKTLEEAIEDPLQKPDPRNKLALAKWAFLYPLNFISVKTIPDCRQEKFAKYYVVSFFIAISWISLYSYVMVWMITIIGFTFGVPDTVMGLTFIAAGVSVPDALSGIAVVKEGHGDMAVSNAIGSNVFDILVCLGIPWFIKTAIISPGTYITIKSKGLVYSTLSLFSTVVFLIVASHFNGWKLDKKFGVILLIWYFIFMIFASMYELNVFGEFNPPECQSDY